MRGRALLFWMFVIVVCVLCIGCGETIRGMSKDARRIGKGVRTIFVAEE